MNFLEALEKYYQARLAAGVSREIGDQRGLEILQEKEDQALKALMKHVKDESLPPNLGTDPLKASHA